MGLSLIHISIAFCKLNAWKYRYRAGEKDSAEEDMKKADWYIGKVMELRKMITSEAKGL